MQVAVAAACKGETELISPDQVDRAVAALVEIGQQEVTARTASEAVEAAAPTLMRAETVATAS